MFYTIAFCSKMQKIGFHNDTVRAMIVVVFISISCAYFENELSTRLQCKFDYGGISM